MLTLEPARRPRAGRTKLAIALAGGGPLGAFYELGALHALSEAIEGRDLNEADVYTGVSSGALLAAGLANGFDTAAMSSMLGNPAVLLQPAVGEYLTRLGRLPSVLAEAAQQYIREPANGMWPATLSSASRLVPAAVFDNLPLEKYLEDVFNSRGHTNDFRKLDSRLYVVATNLNTAEAVPFGGPGNDRVPISRAVLASAALPGLYSPVKIGAEHYVDGALVRTMNASLALEEGCNLVICINPLVPFDASRSTSRAHANLADEGLPLVLSQTFRSLIHSRMKVGMASYRLRYPAADTLLLEPDRNDERFFFTNMFRYAGRNELTEHAYQCTRRDLLGEARRLAPLLKRRGLTLNTEVLCDPGRSFTGGAASRVAQDLDRALERLERLLADR